MEIANITPEEFELDGMTFKALTVEFINVDGDDFKKICDALKNLTDKQVRTGPTPTTETVELTKTEKQNTLILIRKHPKGIYGSQVVGKTLGPHFSVGQRDAIKEYCKELAQEGKIRLEKGTGGSIHCFPLKGEKPEETEAVPAVDMTDEIMEALKDGELSTAGVLEKVLDQTPLTGSAEYQKVVSSLNRLHRKGRIDRRKEGNRKIWFIEGSDQNG